MTESVKPDKDVAAMHAQRIQELENSAPFREVLLRIKNQMKSNLHWKWMGYVVPAVCFVTFYLFRLWAIPLLLIAGYFIYWPLYQKRKALFAGKVRTNDDIYLNDFLTPILKEVFPKATLELHVPYPKDVLEVISPRSSTYNTFTQLAFHDSRDLTVTNLYAYHKETRSSTSNGKTTSSEVKVTDFDGQLFSLTMPYIFPGHMRVVPTEKSAFLKREVRGAYPGAKKGEVQIETEDIRHNENYNIYCTDEFTARKFLTPKILEWFDQQIAQNAMCVYFKDNKLYISLYTNRYIFPTPENQNQIEYLSLVTEYHKLCGELGLIDGLTAIFEGE